MAWSRPPGGQVDVGANTIKAEVLPHLQLQNGFCSASMFADREHGMLCGTVSFDSAATVEGNREFGAQARATMTERSGIEWVEVMEFELAVHHLRVPELI